MIMKMFNGHHMSLVAMPVSGLRWTHLTWHQMGARVTSPDAIYDQHEFNFCVRTPSLILFFLILTCMLSIVHFIGRSVACRGAR